MPGLLQASSMIQNLKSRSSRTPSTKNSRKNVLALSTLRQGNPAILECFGKDFKEAFVEAKQMKLKKALECVEEPPTEKTIVDDIVEEEKLQLVNDQRDVNTQISSVNIYCESDSRRNADGNGASDRISFLESEVATYEQVVAAKENEILDIQEDHQAVVDDLKEQLAAAEARLATTGADLKKEQVSKKKIMTQRNEFANNNRQLKAQVGTGQPGDSRLVRAHREEVEQLHAQVRNRDEELATATASLKKEHCDGNFWHGAYILTISELEQTMPDAAQRYNGIVRRKDERIAELSEQLEQAREVAREAYTGRERDRIEQSGTLRGYRKWAVEFQRSTAVMSDVYEKLQGHVGNVGRALVSKMPRDDVTEALTEACERINIENDKLSQAANNFQQQVVAQHEANAASEAKIVELEATLELKEQEHELRRSEPRALQRQLDEKDGSHEIAVDDLTDKVQELEKALDKRTKAKDSLERQAIAGTVAETVISGLNDQIYGLKQEIANLKADKLEWVTAYAHQNGALLEARGVGSDGQDLDIGISGVHSREIMDLQVETLRRRAKIAEAPVLASLGKFLDRIEKNGGTLASWGIQYEDNEVDTG